jgi:hypothetical protein
MVAKAIVKDRLVVMLSFRPFELSRLQATTWPTETRLVFQMTLMTMGLYNEPMGTYMPSVL